MKKYILILLALACVLALSACGGGEGGAFGKEEVSGEEVVQIEGSGLNVDMDADAAKVILGVYDAKTLGLAKDIYEYDLVISSTKFEGVVGVKIEAYDPEGKKDAPAAGVFMIADGQNYRFDAKQNKYVLIGGTKTPSAQTTKKAEPVTDENGQVVETAAPVPDDPSITFQYHKGNNAALQERFAKYDISVLKLANRLTDYVFVVTERTAVSADGTIVNIVELYSKAGEEVAKLGISETGDYYFDVEASLYVALEEGTAPAETTAAQTTAAAQ